MAWRHGVIRRYAIVRRATGGSAKDWTRAIPTSPATRGRTFHSPTPNPGNMVEAHSYMGGGGFVSNPIDAAIDAMR